MLNVYHLSLFGRFCFEIIICYLQGDKYFLKL